MPDLPIAEFVDKVCEIMPIMMKGFFRLVTVSSCWIENESFVNF